MTALGQPLTAYVALGYCDRQMEHEIRLVTDGQTGYAYGTCHGSTETRIVGRDAAVIVVACEQWLNDADQCEGEAVFTLASNDWVTDPEELAEALDLITRYGVRIDR